MIDQWDSFLILEHEIEFVAVIAAFRGRNPFAEYLKCCDFRQGEIIIRPNFLSKNISHIVRKSPSRFVAFLSIKISFHTIEQYGIERTPRDKNPHQEKNPSHNNSLYKHRHRTECKNTRTETDEKQSEDFKPECSPKLCHSIGSYMERICPKTRSSWR